MPVSPIPRNLLPHSITYNKMTGLDARGKKTFATGVPVYYVRFENAKRNALTALGEQRNDNGLLFYDEMNSYPAGIIFSPGDEIVYNTRTYVVRESVPEYSVYGTPHHQEVALL